MRIFSKGTLNAFDYFLILGILFFNILYSALTNQLDFIGSLASVTGIMCVVLVAKRSISNYLFGIVSVSLYAYISYKTDIYGNFFLNALYYLPMQFIGWVMWMKDRGGCNSKGEADSTLIKSRSMSLKKKIIFGTLCLITVACVGFLLQQYTTDSHPYKDSLTTVLSIAAMFLMVRKYREQWFLWCLINIFSVVIWLNVWYSGGTHAVLMVAMWAFYLANSINGLRLWSVNSVSS